ncbi:MAG: glutamic-type intramembrane protease PrsW [Candidatus Cohnella colombiensis]|uniref:Protease PrsW n=1 Tax=Candidatus Cohnella colombiensis TaxID=3121368 RepID=A0AA95EZ71_9BACL|nr:MAG: glutamic-type intramembrane protease PrsW [Cohnella sp.]
MPIVSVLAASIAPGIALLAYFYLKDRYDTEPLPMVLKMFLIGVLIVLPIIIVQRGMIVLFGDSPFVSAFISSAMVEEFFKWFVLYHLIYNHTEFDEPYDGIVYAVAVSLGFATLENVLYAFMQPATFGTLMARALLPVSGHALFGVYMGYAFGRAKFTKDNNVKSLLLLAFIFPVVWHGFFDYIMLTVSTTWIWLIVPFMFMLWFVGMRFVKRANAVSPFRL